MANLVCFEPIKPTGVALADPTPCWYEVSKETDAAWCGRPLANPACPELRLPKFAWKVSTLPDRARRALQATWAAIALDAISPHETVPATFVRELVASCGYMEGYPRMYGNDLEAVAWLELQSPQIQKHLLHTSFPRGRYGL